MFKINEGTNVTILELVDGNVKLRHVGPYKKDIILQREEMIDDPVSLHNRRLERIFGKVCDMSTLWSNMFADSNNAVFQREKNDKKFFMAVPYSALEVM